MAAVDSNLLRADRQRQVPPVVLLSLAGVCAAFLVANVRTTEWTPAAVVIGGIAAGAFIVLCPVASLRVSFFLIVLATTKFRSRDPNELLSGGIDGEVIFELLCYAAALAAVVVNLLPVLGRYWRRLTRIEIVLGGYVALALVSVAWSANPLITAGRGIELAILYLLCVVAVRRLGPETMMRTFAASLVIYVLIAAGLAAAFPWARHKGPYFSWFSVHPGEAGGLAGEAAMIMVACAMYASERWRRFRRLVLWGVIAACIAAMLGAHERTPLFAFVAVTLTLWMRRHLRTWAAGLALCAILALAGFGLRTLAESAQGEAPTTSNPVAVYLLRGQNAEQFMGLSGRVELWDYVRSLVQEQPILGHGYVASRSLMLARFPWAGTSHGAVPEVLLNLGFVGAALLGMVVLTTFAAAFGRTGARRAPDPLVQALILGGFVFLLLWAAASDSFAGVPGQEILLFFAATVTQQHLASREDAGEEECADAG